MLALEPTHPRCTRCNRPVRPAVELRAAALELEELLQRVRALRRGTAVDQDPALHDSLLTLVAAHAAELRAELSGVHVRCDESLVSTEFLEQALSRALATDVAERFAER